MLLLLWRFLKADDEAIVFSRKIVELEQMFEQEQEQELKLEMEYPQVQNLGYNYF